MVPGSPEVQGKDTGNAFKEVDPMRMTTCKQVSLPKGHSKMMAEMNGQQIMSDFHVSPLGFPTGPNFLPCDV